MVAECWNSLRSKIYFYEQPWVLWSKRHSFNGDQFLRHYLSSVNTLLRFWLRLFDKCGRFLLFLLLVPIPLCYFMSFHVKFSLYFLNDFHNFSRIRIGKFSCIIFKRKFWLVYCQYPSRSLVGPSRGLLAPKIKILSGVSPLTQHHLHSTNITNICKDSNTNTQIYQHVTTL